MRSDEIIDLGNNETSINSQLESVFLTREQHQPADQASEPNERDSHVTPTPHYAHRSTTHAERRSFARIRRNHNIN